MTPVRDSILTHTDYAYKKIFNAQESVIKKLPVKKRDHIYNCMLLINAQAVARIKAVCYDVFRK